MASRISRPDLVAVRYFPGILLTFCVACSDNSLPVQPQPEAVRLVHVSGDSLTGKVTEPLTRLTVRAEDGEGHPVAGTRISFFIPLGSTGSIDTVPVFTNNEGEAVSGMWTLGTRSGTQQVRVHAEQVATIFSAIALPDAPSQLERFSGNGQVALAGTAVRVPPAVRIVDRFGNGVPNVPVHFTPLAGSILGAAATTDSAGVASVDSWTFPVTGGAVSLVAESPMLPGHSVQFDGHIVSVLFNIGVRITGGSIPPALQRAFEIAAAKWTSVFSQHAGVSQVSLSPGGCGASSPAIDEVVTDVLVLVRVAPIDGHENVLASAASCAFHQETGLPVVGRITVDSSDVEEYTQKGWIDLIATHEMGHALGFGSMWERRGLIGAPGAADPRFTGLAAAREFASVFTSTSGTFVGTVPVENTGGAGTADRHWRSSIFGNELMNGFIASPSAPLSRITIGSMEDLGYGVRYDAADPYPVQASAIAFGTSPLTLHVREAASDDLPMPTIMPMVRRTRHRN